MLDLGLSDGGEPDFMLSVALRIEIVLHVERKPAMCIHATMYGTFFPRP